MNRIDEKERFVKFMYEKQEFYVPFENATESDLDEINVKAMCFFISEQKRDINPSKLKLGGLIDLDAIEVKRLNKNIIR